MAGYFSKFPQVSYDLTAKTDPSQIVEVVTDLTVRNSIVISDADLEKMCQRYTVMGGELPEHVSQNFYGTPDLAWTIFYINGIGDITTEWPMSDIEVSRFVTKKYGAGFELNVHHYEKLPEGVWMDYAFIVSKYGAASVNTVTNLDYEIQQNELKRMIYVIKPENVSTFVSQYMKLISSQ